MTKQEFLAMSLPYGLQILVEKDYNDNVVEVIKLLHGISMFGKKFYIGCAQGGIATITKPCNCKPILHPLTDLTKDRDKEDSLFWRLEEFACNTRDAASMYDHSGLSDINWIQEPFEIVMWLIKEHFDIAGLIEKGEAIDVNTLPENPYK